MKEMQELREVREAIAARKAKEESVRAESNTLEAEARKKRNMLVAALFIDLGRDGFSSLAGALYALDRDHRQVDEVYKDEIAAVKAERERAMFDAEKEDLSDPEVYLKPQPGDELTSGQMRDAPDGTVIKPSPESLFRWKKIGSNWHREDNGDVGILGSGYYLVQWGAEEEAIITPQPGDRLTVGQLKDAPDGTVIQNKMVAKYHYTKDRDNWYFGYTVVTDILMEGHILVRWGNPS